MTYKKTVFIPMTGSKSDWEPVAEMFKWRNWNVVHNEQAHFDLLCFTGGSDVSPYLYDEENISSYCDPVRDEAEKEIYLGYIDKPKVGICRGGQFLNVMNGGKMIQHIDGHSGDRAIFVDTQFLDTYVVREDHHQGILPNDDTAVYIGYDVVDKNAEIVWYENTKSLCFQPHPEWGHEGTEELFFDLLNEYITFGEE